MQSEHEKVVDALERWRAQPAAVATVVGTEGSTYRTEGVRMVVPAEGEAVGTLSGGCLEPAVRQVADEVIREDAPRLVSYDLTGEEEAFLGWKLGCQGRMEVLIAPIRQSAAVAAALRRVHDDGVRLAVVTALEGEDVGRSLAVDTDQVVSGTLGDARLDEAAAAAARAALSSGEATGASRVEGRRMLIEVLEPALRLLVCGAGEDARPVVEFAARLGWRVAVADHREALLDEERFPAAHRLLVAATAEELVQCATIDARTYVLLITHDYPRDKELLRALLPGAAPYIGVVGPASRLQRLLDELQSEGVTLDVATRRRLHGPAGLDLGAEGPEEIAWSIIAEILAVARGRSGGPLASAEP